MNVSKKIIALQKIYFLKELGFLTIERSKKEGAIAEQPLPVL